MRSRRRRPLNRQVLVGGSLVLLTVIVALVSLLWTPRPPQAQDLAMSLLPPFWMDGARPEFPLGTDLNGRAAQDWQKFPYQKQSWKQ